MDVRKNHLTYDEEGEEDDIYNRELANIQDTLRTIKEMNLVSASPKKVMH